MSQDKIQITNTPPLPGTQLVQELNDAFEALATDFSGSVDPAAYAFAYSLWADTGTGDLKRRNAANNAWTVIGRIYPGIFENASGNVGIGTSSPTSVSGYKALNIKSANGGELQLGNTAGTAQAIIWCDADGITYTNFAATSQKFIIAGEEIFRINSAKNFLIGTNVAYNTNYKVHLSPDSGTGVIITRATAASHVPMLFENSAGVGVGAISCDNTNTTFATSSDHRLKENIQPMQGALDFVRKQRPVTYTWKTDGSQGSGYIAHWMQEDGAGQCVTGEKDAVRMVDELDEEGNKIGEKEVPQYQGIDTSFMVAPLNAAIIELADKFDQLKAEFDAYKAAHP